MTDTPADAPYVMGPGPDYTPPPTPPDPERTAAARERGRAACLAALEHEGITKTPAGRWVRRDETTEGARP